MSTLKLYIELLGIRRLYSEGKTVAMARRLDALLKTVRGQVVKG